MRGMKVSKPAGTKRTGFDTVGQPGHRVPGWLRRCNVATPTGLTFIVAPLNGYFRAFRTAKGKELKEVKSRRAPGPRP